MTNRPVKKPTTILGNQTEVLLKHGESAVSQPDITAYFNNKKLNELLSTRSYI